MTSITKKQKEEYSEKHFGNCKPKELKEITFNTPQNHEVKALICRKPNRYLGSLLILEVDKKPVEQFVQGMPKIHYLDNYHMLKSDEMYGYSDVYEKLDGTNICLYGLKDSDGKIIEIVPKSRNMGVLDEEFYKKYEECNTYAYEEFIKDNPNYICYFELYGMGNLHMVKHMETWLDMKFLGLYDGNQFVKDSSLGIPYYRRPRRLFRIYDIKECNGDSNRFYVNSSGLDSFYHEYMDIHGEKCKTMEECIDFIKETLESLNKEYEKVNGRIAVEGVVVNGLNMNNEFQFIKVKPETIEMAHKSENGIPRQYIMKEIMKYMDEYKSVAKENWETDSDGVMEYINNNLRESFDQIYIDKSQSKIRRLFESKVYPQPPSEEIMEIGDHLLNEYPTKSVTELMRIFGQNYPYMKKSGGKLYKYLEEKTYERER